MLRGRMGTDALAVARECHGGLLSLLEKHSGLFSVERIPKNDAVTLIATDSMLQVRRPGVDVTACGGAWMKAHAF